MIAQVIKSVVFLILENLSRLAGRWLYPTPFFFDCVTFYLNWHHKSQFLKRKNHIFQNITVIQIEFKLEPFKMEFSLEISAIRWRCKIPARLKCVHSWGVHREASWQNQADIGDGVCHSAPPRELASQPVSCCSIQSDKFWEERRTSRHRTQSNDSWRWKLYWYWRCHFTYQSARQ